MKKHQDLIQGKEVWNALISLFKEGRQKDVIQKAEIMIDSLGAEKAFKLIQKQKAFKKVPTQMRKLLLLGFKYREYIVTVN